MSRLVWLVHGKTLVDTKLKLLSVCSRDKVGHMCIVCDM